MSKTSSRGALICFEGVDRSGKSTQCEMLVQALREHYNTPTKLISFPDRSTSTGKLIDAYLKRDTELLDGHAVHLLFSANRWEMMDKVRDALEDGITVVMDRYAYSGVTFSVANGLDKEWCLQADKGLPKPDVVFFLDIPIAYAMQRADYGAERYEHEAFQRRVLAAYHEFDCEANRWITLDATLPAGKLHEEIAHTTENCIRGWQSKALDSLW